MKLITDRFSFHALAMAGLLLTGCQAVHEDDSPEGPPHPANQSPHAMKNLKRLQGMLDEAVMQGEAGQPETEARRKAQHPPSPSSFPHPQHLHLVPTLKSAGLGTAPSY